MTRNEHIVIRSASAADDHALAVLAVIDGGRRLPEGRVLLAEVDGRVRAAVGANGSAISDPFWPSAGLVSLLRVHSDALEHTANRAPRISRRRLALA